MDRIRGLVRTTFTAGILVLISLAFSAAALADISHGEPDLSLEWGMLRVSALLIVMYLGLSFATIRSLLKRSQDPAA